MIISGALPLNVQQAVDALCAGELVGLPTETVYGLAADASNAAAVAKIFKAKGKRQIFIKNYYAFIQIFLLWLKRNIQ